MEGMSITPRPLGYRRLAEIEQMALASDSPEALVLRELLSHAAHHETIGLGSYFESFADAAEREEQERADWTDDEDGLDAEQIEAQAAARRADQVRLAALRIRAEATA